MKKTLYIAIFMALLICTAFAPKGVSAQVINDVCIVTPDGDVIFEADQPITWGAKLENLELADDFTKWDYIHFDSELVYNKANNKSYYIIHTRHAYVDPAVLCIRYFNGIENGQHVEKYIAHDFIVKGKMASNGPLFTPNWNGTSFNFKLQPQVFSFVRE